MMCYKGSGLRVKSYPQTRLFNNDFTTFNPIKTRPKLNIAHGNSSIIDSDGQWSIVFQIIMDITC